MKRICIALLLIPLAAASCQAANEATQAVIALTQTAIAQSGATGLAVPTETATLTQTTTSNAAEEAEIRDLVENFGKRLQDVSLQSPSAPQEMQKQYSAFVSPTLLEMWKDNVSKAPGRIVSSPWPDRIEITTLVKEGSDRYVMTGMVVELTSAEVVGGGAAAKIPVRIAVQKGPKGWLITEYAEER